MITFDDLKARQQPMHVYYGGGRGAWLVTFTGIPRIAACKERGRLTWSIDGKVCRDLSAALAVLNGQLSMEEAMQQPVPAPGSEKPPCSRLSAIAEIKRELDVRVRVYPNLVRTGGMRQGHAELQTLHMQGALYYVEHYNELVASVAELDALIAKYAGSLPATVHPDDAEGAVVRRAIERHSRREAAAKSAA